jgi:D-sedoheptulose 7-phosphate isomerase
MVEQLDLSVIEKIADVMASAFREKKKAIIFGNGGSAADAMHFAAELEGQLSSVDKGRKPLRVITPCNLSAITAIANDFGYEQSFARFVQANTDAGDVVIGISTSGNSPNLLLAMEAAKSLKGVTVGLTGGTGGKLQPMVDHCLVVPAQNVSIIQEGHLIAYHRICALLIRSLFHVSPM